MRVLAPAKINLHLRVGPTRADGFHPLLTWMVTAGLFDTLTFVRRRDDRPPAETSAADDATGARAGGPAFALSCDHPSLPVDAAGNLVTRVATALADTLSRVGEGATAHGAFSGWTRERVSAFLIKRIPPGAGLGGGSSDAATTLMALNARWKLDWSRRQLSEFAARFGSDLSFFFDAPSAVCTGRGEVVRPTPAPDICRWAVLVLPAISMPTPAVYKRFDEMGLGREDDVMTEPDWLAWSKLPAAELLPRLVNDLEPPAFAIRPELGELRSALEQKLSRIVRMSGSGSSLFTLCDTADEAALLSQRARDEMNVDARPVQLAPALPWETSEPTRKS
jgi:4-diphosphocytidyl-2-C-methyl-D-erythritol kinase